MRWTKAAVDGGVTVRTNGGCGLFSEDDRWWGMLKGEDVGAILQLDWFLIVVDLKSNEMVGTNAKLNRGGDITNARRDCECNGCEDLTLWVVDVYKNWRGPG